MFDKYEKSGFPKYLTGFSGCTHRLIYKTNVLLKLLLGLKRPKQVFHWFFGDSYAVGPARLDFRC